MKDLSLARSLGSVFEKGNISQKSSYQCQPKGYRNSRINIPHVYHNYNLDNFLNLTDNTRQTIANRKSAVNINRLKGKIILEKFGTITIAPNQAAAKLTIKSDKTEYQLPAGLIN